MELKLNIYEKRNIVKTYKADTYDLMFGTVEDFLELIDVDKLKSGNDAELIMLVGKAIPKGMGTIKELMKDVFEDITDEELKHTKVKELSLILINIVKTSIAEIGKGVSQKN